MADDSILLVEGTHDKDVVERLWSRHFKTPQTFKVEAKEGIDRVKDSTKLYLKVGNVKKLGVIVDADENLSGCWQAFRDILIKSQYTTTIIPKTPNSNGTVIRQKGLPDFGIWIMPDNQVKGKIENFISTLVPSNDSLWNFAVQSVKDAAQIEQRYKPTFEIKAQVHTWLAWQKEPGTSLGLAVTRKYLDSHNPQALLFIKWLESLFT